MNRDFTDLVKLSPHVTSGQTDGPSAAGAYNRFNNFTIDGANQNDRFNLGASEGVPGGATGGRLISIDAVKEFQVLLTPADVRHGNFAGMIVNAVTKSGTNTFSGGVSYAYRDPEARGESAFHSQQRLQGSSIRVLPRRSDHQGSAALLHRTRVPDEVATQHRPVRWAVDRRARDGGSGARSTASRPRSNQLFPIGGTGLVNNDNPLGNLSGRIDWAISDNHRFAIRQLINSAEQDEFSRNASTFNTTVGAQNSGFRYTSNSFIRQEHELLDRRPALQHVRKRLLERVPGRIQHTEG